MFTDLASAVRLASDVARSVAPEGQKPPAGVEVAVCPPFVSLEAVAEIIRETPVRLGAQNMHHEDEGAFTGEVSAPMLVSSGCDFVIVGHSERRSHFGESDETVGRKLAAALRHGLVPILCVGETLEERDRGDEEAVVERQLTAALNGATVDDADLLVVAYEPVWAIGTGRTASPEQAQAMHAMIRNRLGKLLGSAGVDIKILYGGSVKPDNAAELFRQQDIDGGLIGGASLEADSFARIVAAAVAAA